MNSKETFVIEGLGGKKPLSGSVRIHGAKNAALKAMAAAILFDGPVLLRNVPKNNDVDTLSDILRKLGAIVDWQGEELKIDASQISSVEIDAELAASMRASVVLTGPLLAHFGKVSFPAPGGCVIGARPIDLFLAGYEKMGAASVLDDKLCAYEIAVKGGLKGMEMFFNKVSVGGTETLMMAAVLANGTTILKNCAMEPEIGNVAEWLVSCGAKITGIGTPTLIITGTGGKLLSPQAAYTAIPDRIEAGSFLILGALCAKDLKIENCRPEHLDSLINLLKDSGIPVSSSSSTISITGNVSPNASLRSLADLRTHEFPGFPTDLQPVIVTFLSQVTGESKVLETIYEGRFKYVEDLIKIGADITIMNPHEIAVKGPTALRALPGDGDLNAHDIRAGFALVLAALCASGTFRVNNIKLIDRGYEELEVQLSALGAQIKRVVV